MATAAPAAVSVNYLGVWDQALGGTDIRLVREGSGLASDPRNGRPYALEIGAYVLDGCLHLSWTYRADRYQAATIEARLAETVEALRALAAQALEPGAGHYTPSDFPDVALTQEELDSVINSSLTAGGGVDG